MGEFQIATAASDQDRDDLLIDSILAGAIAAAGGDVRLLVAVLQPGARKLWADSQQNFVVRVHEFAERCSHDPKYQRVFARYSVPDASPASTDTSTLPNSPGVRRKRYSVILLTSWRRWWTALNSAVASIVRPPKSQPGLNLKAVGRKPAEPIVEPAVESQSLSCGASVRLEDFSGHCENGLIVPDQFPPQLCPSCMGQKRREVA